MTEPELSRSNTIYEGTRFESNETIIDIHAGNPDLIDLVAAREARAVADAEIAAARKEAADAETRDSEEAWRVGECLNFYRGHELREAA